MKCCKEEKIFCMNSSNTTPPPISLDESKQHQLVMTDKLRQVLTTTQPNLSTAQVNYFIQEVLKE